MPGDGHARKLIWIDIENPPQVQYLLPFREAFKRAGADVVVTARDHGFALDLLRQSGVPFKAVGTSLGRSKWRKVRGTFARSTGLRSLFARGGRPHAVLCASRASALAARRLRIPSFVIIDYEYVHLAVYRLTGSWILHPSVIDRDLLARRGARRSRLIPFEGLKEDISFSGFDLDAVEPFPLAAPAEAARVLFRPPAEQSHYFESESLRASLDALDRLRRMDDVVVVYSPREAAQVDYVRRFDWVHEPVVLDSPAPFVPLLKAVDAVVSSGGTMLREAAYLGVSAYSTFRSEIGGVDRHLQSIGRLTILSSPEDLDGVGALRGHRQPVLDSNPRLLEELATAILARARQG
jgi:uncharacterized protein